MQSETVYTIRKMCGNLSIFVIRKMCVIAETSTINRRILWIAFLAMDRLIGPMRAWPQVYDDTIITLPTHATPPKILSIA